MSRILIAAAVLIGAVAFVSFGLVAQPEPGQQVEPQFLSKTNPKLRAGYQRFLLKSYRTGRKNGR